jgi:DNA-binding CsgD family transcriptional regulator
LHLKGDNRAADAAAQKCLVAMRDSGDEVGVDAALHTLAWIALTDDDLDRTMRYLGQLLPRVRTVSHPVVRCGALHTAGALALEQCDLTAAQARLVECVEATPPDTPLHLAYPLEGLAIHAARTERPERALRLKGAAVAIRAAAGSRPNRWWSERVDIAVAIARMELSPRVADAAEGAGSRLDTSPLVAYACTDVWSGPAAASAASPLSQREWAVAHLVARDLTIPQIGTRLNTPVRTVDAHLRNIRVKLNVRSREEITEWVTNHPLSEPQFVP